MISNSSSHHDAYGKGSLGSIQHQGTSSTLCKRPEDSAKSTPKIPLYLLHKSLKLLRTGNLVLTDAKNNTKWQCFDFPAHIMLWGQRLYTPTRLTSLAADSTSLYSMEIQDEKIAMYLNSGSLNYSYWEFKPNKGQIIEFVELGSTGLKLFSKRHRKVAQISSNSLEPIRFLALGKTGNLEFYHYSLYKGKFEASFQVLNGTCDLPLTCGPYGICRSSNTCTCMRILNKTEHIQSECDEGLLDRFCESNVTVKMVELEGVTSVLRSAHPMINVSKEECINLCAADCSCASVLFSFGGVAGEQRECFHYQLVGGVKQVEREVGVSYLIKVPQELIDGKSRNSSGIKKWILIVGGVVNLLAVLFILGGVVWYILTRKRKKATPRENS
ncbi:G-type lectin S-receptor-like serine/threonine-protein kinase SD2-5 isoform X1 [Cinnamomum micranthum f. kanehirae]|uniref:G-type lectin S-receptor-like serine/threonine-protein kinase SD2-5 isoform X1 n=1 Tax=Cinnamomum micranthum f. kanehirae TaxID=337451 RepID=A0A443PN61_9MAGN|nr:G-type lectin S-receptor-like serine/threonine-protein kinase SD2-5 isoform X1 [Cinnamomum micranthum f. kanehirae]